MRLLYPLLLLLISLSTYATHNRAGEILYKRISDLEYEITIITYTDISGPNADRCSLDINWGDGSNLQPLPRTNGAFASGCFQGEEIVAGQTKKNIYVGTHTYPSPGTYLVGMLDQNRNVGIANIPNSVNIPFYIESIIKIAPGIGPNSSPELLNPPIDEGCVGEIFEHNPGAYDVDGDSLSYKLVSSLEGHNTPIPGYTMPSASNSFAIDAVTGDLVWDEPLAQGEYNIAIEISEWRNGQIISKILRDMQVLIRGCDNKPPEIKAIADICVKAGETLIIPFVATDPDPENAKNYIELTATGGPFEVNNPATFTSPNGNGSVTSDFVWVTNCSHVRKAPYQVSIKATNIIANQPDLVDFYTLFITVLSPGPDAITATAVPNAIQVDWNPNPCSDITGYELYRKAAPFNFIPGECEVGVPAYTGYQKIADIGPQTITYTDDNDGNGLDIGLEYCYRVIGVFEDGGESFTSPEACAALKKQAPVITQVDVVTTLLSGEIYLEWSKPTEFDTLVFPGPYSYKVFQSEGQDGASLVEIATFNDLNDTTLTVLGINTEDLAYSFRIDLIDDGLSTLIGSSTIASSERLSAAGAGNRVELSWQGRIPWLNDVYYIYRLDPISSNYVFIDSTENRSYIDEGLQNGEEYCYYIESKGSYSASGYKSPLLNRSQRTCATPIDTVPPCKPQLNVISDCDILVNRLDWEVDYEPSCELDVEIYQVYYTAVQGQEFSLIAELSNIADSSFTHFVENSVAGCYYIVAIDSNNNVSEPSDEFCVENCSEFELPNVFTPNGDSENDLFIPVSSQFIERLEITIYNRWGTKVFETTDPQINWDGINQTTGQLCADGVYFYDCSVHEIKLSGVVIRQIGGFVHLISSK